MDSNQSVDDLRFEIRCLNQKLCILQGNYDILKEEKQIAEHILLDTTIYDKELTILREELTKSRILVNFFSSKLFLVKQNLNLERKTLTETRMDSLNFYREMNESYQVLINKLLSQFVSCERKEKSTIKQIEKKFDENFDLLEKKNDEIIKSTKHDLLLSNKEIEKLRAICLVKDQRISAIENEKASFRLACLRKEDAIATLETQTRAAAATHRDDMEKENAKAKAQCDALNHRLAEQRSVHQEVMGVLAEGVRTERMRADQLEVLLADLRKVLERAVLKQEQLLRERDAVSASLRAAVEEAASQRERVLRLEAEGAELRRLLHSSEAQRERLTALQEALQGDVAALLERERQLRRDLGDKGEVQQRLRSVELKVRSLDADHATEMQRLQGLLEEERRLRETAVAALGQESQRAVSLQADARAAAEKLQAAEAELWTARLMAETAVATAAARVEALEQELRQREALEEQRRKETVDLSDQRAALLLQAQTGEQLLAGLVDSRDALAAELEQTRRQLTDRAEAAEAAAAGLRETVRRECEERVQLLLTIAEMRDRTASAPAGREEAEAGSFLPALPARRVSAASGVLVEAEDGAASWGLQARRQAAGKGRRGRGR